jgi:ligand-binding sensor domain-containing protein/signal transduction histidine kinase
MSRLLSALLLASLSALPGLAGPGIPVQYVHHVWRAESGLPQNTVTSVTQSRDGYLWIGTEEGLVRFDGIAFATFNADNSALRNNLVLAVREDRQGALWVGTKGGLTRLRSGKDRTYTSKDGLAGDVITSLYEDRQGDLWAGTDGGGVSRIRNGKIENFGTAKGLPAGTVFAVAGDPQGGLWFGTGSGLARWNGSRFEAVRGLPNEDIRALLGEEDGSMWIGTNGGGLIRRERDGSVTSYGMPQGLGGNKIRSVLRDSEGTLWVAALDSGLHRLVSGRFEALTADDSTAPRDVWWLFEDREHSLWTGTIGAGLHRYHRAKVAHLAVSPGRSNDTVLGVFEDRDGGLWLGTREGGVKRWKGGKETVFSTANGLSDPLVFSIAEDRDGDIWIGTRNGLDRLHAGRFTVYTTGDGLPSNTIPTILKDSRGTLWIGTRKGLCRREKDGFTVYTTADGLPNDFVISLREGADGSLWIGTAGGGASRFREGRFTTYGPKQGLSSGVVFDIQADADGTVWLGTSGGGLNRVKDGRISAITARDGLFDNTVFRILADGRDRFWLSSNRGISVVERRDLEDFADGKIRSIRHQSFGVADGAKSQECNGGFQPAGWKTAGGKLYFPTTQGALVIDPADIRRNAAAPHVVLEGALFNGSPADGNRSVEIGPGPGSLEFHFNAPSFLAPKKIAFRYLLEGFDREWVNAGSRREAYYTNIPPGNYRFRVLAANEDGVWNEAGAALPFRLRPYFHQTAVFYGLCAALALLIVVMLHKVRVRQLSLREAKLSARVAQSTRELREQIAARDVAHEELRQVQRRLMELARQSGMAEVAIGVLHNVGNVLNSVSVSATVVEEKVKESHTDHLMILAEMLRSHSNDLDSFLRDDPKGRRVIPYLAKLSAQFCQDRDRVLEEVTVLTSHVRHMKEIVATQQAYAKVSGLVEELPLSTLVEDAIRFVEPGLEKHNIAIRCDFEELPQILVDRHGVLQILLNLLRNAMEAIRQQPGSSRIVKVRLRQHGEEWVRIEVEDSGVGLQSEQLTRIFAQGYSTKKGGHGFGLHSGALAARQMSGSLWAESGGLGCGATFTLQLPLRLNVPASQQTRQGAAA